MDLDAPLRTAELLCVDVETNGRPGADCELTEVAAVLVGGGELHDRYASLVAVRRPLGAGIQRFTGITQAMVAAAPPARDVLAELAARLEGRVLVAHSAAFDRRVLRAAFAAEGLAWPDPPTLCTVALARRFAPLARQRALAPLAAALGIDVAAVHRALPDAETCARVLCALFPRLCAHAATVGEAVALLRPRRAGRARRPTVRPPGARASGLDFSGLPDGPGVYLFRDAAGRPLYVGKSTAIRTRARSHFAPGAEAGAWIAQAALVDHRSTGSELGALVLENRLIKRLRPPGNVALTRVDGVVFVRCRLDIPFPVLEVARDPAAGHAVTVGPLRGRAAAAELVEQLTSLWGLRHCGRGLRRREWPSAYGQMGRCLSPCLGDLDPNLYRRRLDEALALFAGRDDARTALLAHLDREMRAAAADRRFERAAWLRRRRERLRVLLDRLGGVLQATHARPRLVVAAAPGAARPDVLWLVEGRVADWGPLPDDPAELHARTLAALRRRAPQALSAHVPAAEVDEVRIVTGWLAAHEPPALALDDGPPPDAGTLHAWARTATAGAQPRSATALPRSAAAAAQPRSRPLQGAGRPMRPAQPRDARAT